MDGSPVRMRENSNSPHPNSAIELQRASPQQKPVNLLPAVPIQTSRKLSEREQRDCDIIGKKICIILNVIYIYKEILILIF